ncbi:Response regulator receiver domain-containing protein [Aquimarina amphilecti]|uniref:Response regulator receiver domain-containing protein n=1 Tax=Aquimarina amphilecti TaxID=1038014 RepID=A0A1H7QHN6_AQUAM|nr:response regulator [Aquimarina amphilecti]SEL47620.1 Response regulator receiver domain-containing protein [Aquimarina amphilecti]
MNKLKRILLVDDSKATNFFNKTIILKTDCVEEVVLATNGEKALHSIQTSSVPDIIFLDLNMPVMNGWEFLEQHEELSEHCKNSVIVILLGTKLSTEQEKKLTSFSRVMEFRDKMLTKEIVLEIISTYFKDSVS